MSLINCEINLILTWSENCVLTNKATRDADPDANSAVAAIDNPTNGTFKKRTIKWNKFRSEMTSQTKNNNLNYLIDPIFTKVNRLFVLSFENENDRNSFSKYYITNV